MLINTTLILLSIHPINVKFNEYNLNLHCENSNATVNLKL
jgi:hypothetical protein